MSPDEYEAFAATTEKLSKAHRGSHIEELLSQFLNLLGFAVESERAAAVATAAVAAAGAAVESHRAGALPGEELSTWETVGGCVDEDAVPIVEASAAAAFADLVSRSTRADSSVARLLEVDGSRISQRVGERSLYTFVAPGEERHFPEWQFAGHTTVPGLKQVLSTIPAECHPLSVDPFSTHANVDLELEGEPVAPARRLATGGSARAVSDLAADHQTLPKREHPTRAIAYLAWDATAFTAAIAEYLQDGDAGVGPIDRRKDRPAVTAFELSADLTLLDLDSAG